MSLGSDWERYLLPGEPMPNLTGVAVDLDKKTSFIYNLSKIKSDYLAIFFFASGTPVVDSSVVADIRHNLGSFRANNCTVVGISGEGPLFIMQSVTKDLASGGFGGPPGFLFIADKGTMFAKNYGMKRVGGMICSGVFIFDTERKLRYRASYPHYIGISVSDVLHRVVAVRKKDVAKRDSAQKKAVQKK